MCSGEEKLALKKRLDSLLVEKNLVSGRDKAKAVIMAGLVYVNNQKADKPGVEVDESAEVELRGGSMKYVSRGGFKLEKALDTFPVSLDGAVCMDIGASTGGFTDCMLQNGALKVYAVDVGYGQLAWSLRQDGRVVVLERTNIRYVTREQIPDSLDFISVDVSFISLALVLPVAHGLLKDKGEMVCLIKPQFEAGRDKVGKKGVVREPETHLAVIEKIAGFAVENGFSLLGLDFSPIRGPEGNIEYLAYLQKSAEPAKISPEIIGDVVRRSHEETG